MRVLQGENVWRLVRTDRDAPSASELRQSVGAAMTWFLRSGQPTSLGSRTETAFDLTPSSPNVLREWRVGAARPVQLLAVARSSSSTSPRLPESVLLPKGKKLGDRFSASSDLPLVVGEKPFYVVVRFWWRAPSVDIPYPLLRVNALGVRTREPVTELDWYLDEAVEPEVKTKDPGDETFGQVATEAAGEVVAIVTDAAGKVAGVVVAAGAALALIYTLRKSRK